MDKKKIGLIVTALILFAGVGIAALGNQLTASHFADIDLDKHNFNLQAEGDTIIGQGSGAIHRSYFPINTFERQTDGSYKEVQGQIFGQFMVQDYAKCRLEGGSEATCKQTIHKAEVADAASRFQGEKDRLQAEQETAKAMAQYANELKAGDITITAKEIQDAITAQAKP